MCLPALLPDHHHRLHRRQRNHLGDQPLVLRQLDIAVVRGQEQIAHAADFQLAEQRVRTSILHGHFHAAFALVVRHDLFHGITHARRTVNEQLPGRRGGPPCGS